MANEEEVAKKFPTVVVDPPWPMPRGFNGWGKRKGLPYRSMSIEVIAKIPIGSVTCSEGYVLLWTPNIHLSNAFSILREWGLTYRQMITWCKEGSLAGLGGIVASATEQVLIAQNIRSGTNAHGSRTCRRRSDKNWFTWPRGNHSEKPEEFFSLVEDLLPGPRLEIFARRARPEWVCIGDEIDGRCVFEVLRSDMQIARRAR